MSGLTDRIAETVFVHSPVPHGAHYFRCSYPCRWQYGTMQDHAAHVADRVAAELQLTEERYWSRTDGNGNWEQAVVGWIPRKSDVVS